MDVREKTASEKRLIDYYYLAEKIECPGVPLVYWDDVESAPTVDAVPVVHGRWVEYPRPHYFKCSECKYTVPYRKAMWCNGKREYNYCPNCGAKMDGGADNG